MKIAVLSGKGGAGKTLTAVNLAAAIGNGVYVDCDVEEPNGRLFLNPEEVTEMGKSNLQDFLNLIRRNVPDAADVWIFAGFMPWFILRTDQRYFPKSAIPAEAVPLCVRLRR